MQLAKQAEIDRALDWVRAAIAALSVRDFLIAIAALYAGEGAKTDGCAEFANGDRRMILLFASWLRHFFDVEECRLRAALYLHEVLDLDDAQVFWSALTGSR